MTHYDIERYRITTSIKWYQSYYSFQQMWTVFSTAAAYYAHS